ncbi:MAG: hypothetical protein F4Y97_05535 [Dehalococcoidia bacterium]|nr:hypothetical protein [Dehalococcoidia bacterium]
MTSEDLAREYLDSIEQEAQQLKLLKDYGSRFAILARGLGEDRYSEGISIRADSQGIFSTSGYQNRRVANSVQVDDQSLADELTTYQELRARRDELTQKMKDAGLSGLIKKRPNEH